MAGMWIESTSNETHSVWTDAATKTLNSDPETVLKEVEETTRLIQRIMAQFGRIVEDQKAADNALDLTKCPTVTLSESLMFIVRLLRFSSRDKRDGVTIYHELMLNEKYVSNLMAWCDVVGRWALYSEHLMLSVLALFNELCKTYRALYLSVTAKLWTSCCALHDRWTPRSVDKLLITKLTAEWHSR